MTRWFQAAKSAVENILILSSRQQFQNSRTTNERRLRVTLTTMAHSRRSNASNKAVLKLVLQKKAKVMVRKSKEVPPSREREREREREKTDPDRASYVGAARASFSEFVSKFSDGNLFFFNVFRLTL